MEKKYLYSSFVARLFPRKRVEYSPLDIDVSNDTDILSTCSVHLRHDGIL